MTEVALLRTDVDGLATLSLNRPEKLNSLTIGMFEALERHVVDIARSTDTIGAVLIRGAGPCFSAGNDLGEIAVEPPRPNLQSHVIESLALLPQPVVAAVHGYCFTGALELALAADIIIASETAQFADTHAKFNLTSVWGMSQRLPRRIGTAKAKEMMFTGRHYSGSEAKGMGLASECFADQGFDVRVESFMRDILANSWSSHRVYKQVLIATEGLPIAAGLAFEAHHHPGLPEEAADRISTFMRGALRQ